MPAECYAKDKIEAALFQSGWTILDEHGDFTRYQTNFQPGGDLVLHWSRGKYEWEDLREQLEFQNIDYKPICDYLRST